MFLSLVLSKHLAFVAPGVLLSYRISDIILRCEDFYQQIKQHVLHFKLTKIRGKTQKIFYFGIFIQSVKLHVSHITLSPNIFNTLVKMN